MQEKSSQPSTLSYAASRGYIDDVKKLLNRQNVNERDDLGNTPLHLAAAGGHVNVCMALLKESSIDVNAQNDVGKTPLHEAVWRNNETVVKFLVETAKAKYDIPDKDGHVARDLARNKEVKKLIPDHDEADDWGDLSD